MPPPPVLSLGASQMELTLDPGQQDLLDFLLEESGGLGAPADPSVEAPLDWDLPLSDVGLRRLGEAGWNVGRWVLCGVVWWGEAS